MKTVLLLLSALSGILIGLAMSSAEDTPVTAFTSGGGTMVKNKPRATSRPAIMPVLNPIRQQAVSESLGTAPQTSFMTLLGPELAREGTSALALGTDESLEVLLRLAPQVLWTAGATAFDLLQAEATLTPEAKNRVAAVMMCVWAERDPAAAATWLTQHPEHLENATLVSGLAHNLIEADPAAALVWMEIVPEPVVRDAGLQSLYSEWSEIDLTAAGEWRQNHPEHEAILVDAGL